MAGGDTQLQSQKGDNDDLNQNLDKLLEEEYDRIEQEEAGNTRTMDEEATVGVRNEPGSRYDTEWDWSSKQWWKRSWDCADTWGRSWSHESWSKQDWSREMRRGASADLEAKLQASSTKGDNEQEKARAALNRQPTSIDDQTRPAAPEQQQMVPIRSEEKDEAKAEDPKITPEQQAPIPTETKDQAKAENPKITPEQQAPIPTETKDQAKAENPKITPEQQAPIPAETKDQAKAENPKITAVPEQQAPIPMEIDTAAKNQQQDPSTKAKKQQTPIPTEKSNQAGATGTEGQQQKETIKEETKMGGPGEEWRCDKRGRLLKPHALYMRFYRSIRSSSTASISTQ